MARDTSEPATLVRLDLNTKVTFVIFFCFLADYEAFIKSAKK